MPEAVSAALCACPAASESTVTPAPAAAVPPLLTCAVSAAAGALPLFQFAPANQSPELPVQLSTAAFAVSGMYTRESDSNAVRRIGAVFTTNPENMRPPTTMTMETEPKLASKPEASCDRNHPPAYQRHACQAQGEQRKSGGAGNRGGEQATREFDRLATTVCFTGD